MAARLAYANLLTVSGVTISSSADATGYPASNLGDPARWKKWRSSTTTGDQWVKFDLGSNQSFQVLAAMDVLLHTSGGTLKFQANATDAWGSPTISDTVSVASPDLTRVVADWLSAAQNLRWIRFYFTNTGAVSGYVEIGAVLAAPYFESAQSIAPGLVLRQHDPSVERFAIGGQRSTVVRSKFHIVQGDFALQSAADRETWRLAFATNGISAPCLFTMAPGTASLTFYGVMTMDLQATHRVQSVDYWDVPFTFTELVT